MVIYFSGTGNSEYVARRLAHLSDDKAVSLNEFDRKENLIVGSRIIWVFPIYSWGLPCVVESFIRRVAIKENIPHYMVCTCGDDIGNAHRQWRKLMQMKGWNDVAAYSVIMPNTYTLMTGFDVDSNEVVSRKLNDAPERIEYIVGRIKQEVKEDDVKRGAWAWVKSAIIYPYFKRYCMSPRPFHYTEKCVGCGLCGKECPMGNIKMIDGKPSWDDNCAMCLRCYHVCPHRSVQYGKKTMGKGRYLCPLKG